MSVALCMSTPLSPLFSVPPHPIYIFLPLLYPLSSIPSLSPPSLVHSTPPPPSLPPHPLVSASMSVKDVLQSLVDDGLVDSERIGTSNYFWAFPSKASNQVCTTEHLYIFIYHYIIAKVHYILEYVLLITGRLGFDVVVK